MRSTNLHGHVDLLLRLARRLELARCRVELALNDRCRKLAAGRHAASDTLHRRRGASGATAHSRLAGKPDGPGGRVRELAVG